MSGIFCGASAIKRGVKKLTLNVCRVMSRSIFHVRLQNKPSPELLGISQFSVFKLLSVFALLFFALIPEPVLAQGNTLRFDQIGLEQGLSQSSVNAIIQDSKGFMWFGTQDGLNRYDGYSVKVYKHEPDNLNSISDNIIKCLLSDSQGDLWIGTANGGVNRYVISEDKFYPCLHSSNDSNSISDNTITALFEDSDSNIWIGTNSGLNRFIRKKNTFFRYYFDSVNAPGLNGNSITAVCEDKEDNLWIGTYKGLLKYNLKDNPLNDNSLKTGSGFLKIDNLNSDNTTPYGSIPYAATSFSATPYGNNVTSLYIDHSGSLWVGTFDQPLKRYNIKSKTFILYPNTNKAVSTIYEDSKNNLWFGSINMSLRVLNLRTNTISQIPFTKNDVINALYQDKTGILWIGTGFRGTFIYNLNQNRFKRYLDDPYNPNVVMSIVEDGDGGLWVGTYGNGLKYFNKKRDVVKTYRHNPNNPKSISSDKIFSLCITSDGILWIGTIGGGLNYYERSSGIFNKYIQHSPVDSKSLSNNDITALYEASNGNLLIGNVRGGIDILNRKTKTFSHYYPAEEAPNSIGGGKSVTMFYEDHKGAVWAGTLDGLKYLNRQSKSFVSYNPDSHPGGKTTDYKGITSLLFSDSLIWIGTARNGLLRFSPQNSSVIAYTSNDGLPDNVVLSVLPDSAGNLWLSTNNGISRFNIKDKKFKNYDVNDGLQAKEFNQGAYYKSRSGEMFFGGVNGFNSFYPDEIKDNRNIPPVYITSFKVFDKQLKLPEAMTSTGNISLSYSQNFFSFEFVALNYTAPEKNQYAYFLKGFDKGWHIVSSKQRYASYTNLDPGEYMLRVKASNDDGIWNEEGAAVTLLIAPPFWMTLWFRILVVIILVAAVVAVYKYRVKQIVKLERLRVGIAADLHDEIGSSLGSIVLRSRLLQNEVSWSEKSKEELMRIHKTSSQIATDMRDIVWFVNPDFDKLDDMILRMKDTAQSLLGGVQYDFISPDEILSTKLSLEFRRNVFLSYKEILHNIARHSRASKAVIKVHINNGYFNLEISDNGVGLDPGAVGKDGKIGTKGSGLKNIVRRINTLGGRVKIESGKENGTNIIIGVKTT